MLGAKLTVGKEHIVQWHPTILSKLALIPQNTFNSYSKSESGQEFHSGDLVIRFADCDKKSTKACEDEAKPFAQTWMTGFRNA